MKQHPGLFDDQNIVMKQDLPVWRSMLFVPANVERFISKAHTRGADAIIFDLEDAVPLSEKQVAREAVLKSTTTVSQAGADVLVRINYAWDLAVQDMEAVVDPAISTIVVPKVSSSEQLCAVCEELDRLEIERGMTDSQVKIIAMIESVEALPQLDEIASASPRLVAMILGSEDFSASVGMVPAAEGLLFPNQQVLFAARRAGILPLGFVGSIAEFSDPEAFHQTIVGARRLGFCGAFCIHPVQVAIMNRGFTPTAQEVEHANGLVDAFTVAMDEGRGSAEYQGKMIDYPVVQRAREILKLHEAITAHDDARS